VRTLRRLSLRAYSCKWECIPHCTHSSIKTRFIGSEESEGWVVGYRCEVEQIQVSYKNSMETKMTGLYKNGASVHTQYLHGPSSPCPATLLGGAKRGVLTAVRKSEFGTTMGMQSNPSSFVWMNPISRYKPCDGPGLCAQPEYESQSVKVSQCHSVTCYGVTVSQCLSVTVSRCHSVTVSQCHSVTVSQCHSVTVSQCHSVTVSVSQCQCSEIMTSREK